MAQLLKNCHFMKNLSRKFELASLGLMIFVVSCGSVAEEPQLMADNTVNDRNTNPDPNPEQEPAASLRVPGDYSSIQKALMGPEVQQRSSRTKVVIRIQKAHQVSEPVSLVGGDYSNVHISCKEAIAISDRFPSDQSFMTGSSGVNMPRISCLFDMNSQGQSAYVLSHKSTGQISADAGFINAKREAVNISSGSNLTANNAVFSNAGHTSIVVQMNSFLSCHECIVDNAAKHGILVSDASTAYIRGAKVNAAAEVAIYARRSSSISAYDAEANDAGATAVFAKDASQISFDNGSANKAGSYGLYATNASSISATGALVLDAGIFGVRAIASTIAAPQANVTGAGRVGVLAELLGRVLFTEGDARGSLNQGSGPFDIVVERGGSIQIKDANAANRLNVSVNEFTPDGVIFD